MLGVTGLLINCNYFQSWIDYNEALWASGEPPCTDFDEKLLERSLDVIEEEEHRFFQVCASP